MNIRQRKTGLFEARLCFKGKYFSVYDRDKTKLVTKANKKRKELEKEYKNIKSLAESKKERLILNDWYNEWLETDKIPFVSKATLISIKNAFNVHILPKFKNYKLAELTKGNIQKFLNEYEIGRTRELITTYFKACITQAYKERLIEFNPFDTIITPKKVKSEKKGFTADEQKVILNYLKQNDCDWYKIILCYLCTGCRRNELQTIKIENIKNGLVLIQGTKTNNATRYLNITKEFETVLKETLSIIENINQDTFTHKFSKILEKLKLKGSLHSLRHTFITNHYYLGTQAKQVQTWVGHATINMTMDIYTNIDPLIVPKDEKNKIKSLYNNLYYYTN